MTPQPAEIERLKLVASKLQEFLRHQGHDPWTLNQPVQLSCKGRMTTSVWERKPFVGDEEVRLVDAYYEKGKVWLSAQPVKPDPKIAWIRIEFSRAKEILKGFETLLEKWWEKQDNEVSAETMRDVARLEREAAWYESTGGNKDYGTW